MQVDVYHILALWHQQHFGHYQNKQRIWDLSHREQFVAKSNLINSDKEEWKEYFSEHLKNLNNSFRKTSPNNQISLCAFKSTEEGSLLCLLSEYSAWKLLDLQNMKKTKVKEQRTIPYTTLRSLYDLIKKKKINPELVTTWAFMYVSFSQSCGK